MEAAIRAKLEQALSPEVLELRNESGGHAVPAGSETHFRVAVVSSRFEGMSPLQRHRLVHEALSEELAGPVHALAIQAKTPAQYKLNHILLRKGKQAMQGTCWSADTMDASWAGRLCQSGH